MKGVKTGGGEEVKGRRGAWVRWVGFAAVVVLVNSGGAWLVDLISKDPQVARAVWTSAAVAGAVQLLGFGVATLVLANDKSRLFTAWGAAMAVRFLSLVVYALLVYKVLGLVPAPALISFAGLLFLTSIVEPLFLNAWQHENQQK